MKTHVLAPALTALLLASGCPDGETHMPDIVVDYGYVIDTGMPDTAVRDDGTPDEGAIDIGRDTGHDTTQPVDIIVDTASCALPCPATLRCGPHPCGYGECEPGCYEASKPVCNLETRLCEAEVCVPNCSGKVCGYDGCGGPCGDNDGKCTGGLYCNYTSGQCEDNCYPDCTGKACGDNGCGGTCSPGCPAGVECHEDGYCIDEGKCQAGTELACEVDENSASGETSWNLGVTTMSLFDYSAECGGVFNPGPEKAYRLTVGANEGGLLVVDLSQTLPLLATFLKVYLIEDTGDGCLAANCVAAGSVDTNLTYQVPESASGHIYYLVVDAGVRNNGTFTITIEQCGWNGFDADAVASADN